MGGLIERGAYFKFWLREEGLIREGGLIERGGLIELLRYSGGFYSRKRIIHEYMEVS